MAEFTVTLSSLAQAASEIRTQCEEFRTTGEELKQASDNLTSSADGWMSGSADEFNQKIVDLNTWMSQMAEIINEFSAALEKAEDLYRDADEAAAKNFK